MPTNHNSHLILQYLISAPHYEHDGMDQNHFKATVQQFRIFNQATLPATETTADQQKCFFF